MAVKLNCWEATSCGRESGGARVSELGECPASTFTATDGINGGQNGGRICWAICGTFCGGQVRNLMADKKVMCMNCEFFDRVVSEEGDAVTMLRPGQTRWVGY